MPIGLSLSYSDDPKSYAIDGEIIVYKNFVAYA
jgi:hypothetical protein